jgi:hypothetical protein
VILLRVLVSDQEIETGYGQPWPNELHDPAFSIALVDKAGSRLVAKRQDERFFFLELRRPR